MAITNENLITMDGASELIEKRVKLWGDYDYALKRVSTLESFSAEFDDPNSENLKSSIGKVDTPLGEVDAAIEKINQELEHIQIAESNIRSYQNDIQQITSKFRITATVLIIVILIIIGILVL